MLARSRENTWLARKKMVRLFCDGDGIPELVVRKAVFDNLDPVAVFL